MATRKTTGFEFWEKILGSPRHIVAPMVDQSELAWRMLSRDLGAELCYTPMLHAAIFSRDPTYRNEHFTTCAEDRPLIVQFCANDPDILLEAARHVQNDCDAIDINLGCPQAIAKRGYYGAFLQNDWDLLQRMVSLLDRELPIPVTCKIRVFPEVDKTVEYAKMLEKSGCQLLTVHGRTIDQKGNQTGLASWNHIKAVKQAVGIPVFANGNIQYFGDIERCFRETGVDGIMSAEGNLHNPSLFTGDHPPCWDMVERYLHHVAAHPAPMSAVRGHLFKLWHQTLNMPDYYSFREFIGSAKTVEKLGEVSLTLKNSILDKLSKDDLEKPYSLEDIPFWRCQPYKRPSVVASLGETRTDLTESVKTEIVMKRIKKKIARANKEPKVVKDFKGCAVCLVNHQSIKCAHKCCKKCCREKCKEEQLDCIGHRQYYKSNMWFKDRHQRTLTQDMSIDDQNFDQRLEKEPDNMVVDSNPLVESEVHTSPDST